MDIIEAVKAFFFGIVEGITEWLPISSTGHMMLFNQFVELDVSPEFYDTFLVVIQLGAILAVIILYFNKLNPFAPSKTREQKRSTWGIWGKVVVGSIPPAIIGLLLVDWLEEKVMNNADIAYIVVSAALIAYGIVFIVMERRNKRLVAEAHHPVHGRHTAAAVAAQNADTAMEETGDASNAFAKITAIEDLPYSKAFLIGCFESLAVIPGTSRSGSTIIGSMLLGTSRTVATEFAFFLAIPIMFGWSLVKFLKHGFAYTGTEWMILAIGIVTAFVVSIFSIKFLVNYIQRNDFTAFGIYRIILALVVLAFFGTRALGLF